MSKAKYDGSVPVDDGGNMLPWAGRRWIVGQGYVDPQMRHLPPFDATLRVVDYERGRSAMRVILEDTNTGLRYPMFLSDVFDYLKGVDIEATWEPVKKGQNYGLRVVK